MAGGGFRWYHHITIYFRSLRTSLHRVQALPGGIPFGSGSVTSEIRNVRRNIHLKKLNKG